MDKRIEAFLQDVLALDGEISHLVREGVRRQLIIYEKQFRDAEPGERMKDTAARVCRGLCRARVVEEIRRRKGKSIGEQHLKIVLKVIEDRIRFPDED